MASRIIINNEITFTSEDIVMGSITLEKATDLVGTELSADELRFSVFYDDSEETLRNEAYAVPVVYWEDETIIGTFYLKTVTRIGAKKYTIETASMIGILSTSMHYGGIYNDVPLRLALEEIVLTDGLYNTNPEYHNHIQLNSITVTRGTYVPIPTTIYFRSRVYSRFRVLDFPPSTGAPQYAVVGTLNSKYYVSVAYYQNGYRIEIHLSNLNYVTPWYTWNQIYNRNITLDINPMAGTATCQIYGVVNYSWNITSVQSTSDYINNVSTFVPLEQWCGGNTDGVTLRSLWYRVWNENGTEIIYRGQPYVNLADNKIYWHESINDISVEALGVVDWDYVDRSSTTYADEVPVRQSQIDALANIVYLDGIAKLSVSGWLPIGTKREQIYQLLFAMNVNMRSNATGQLIVGGLANESISTIPDERIYMTGSEKALEKTRAIYLTEHVYTQTTNSETLFDNTGTSPLVDEIVEYNSSPIVGAPTASGLTLTAYNCNAALVSGTGSLTGNVYDHSTAVHKYVVSQDIDGRDIRVSDATLVTYLNVDSVMDRLKSFYNNTVTRIENAIIYGGELCGNKYSFTSPFADSVSAFLSKISVSVTKFAKLMCTFYRNYVAPPVGSDYENYVMLTGNGTWTVPSGVTDIRVVLIGGGSGGQSGLKGESGYNPTYTTEVTDAVHKGIGGAAGENGSGGKILEVKITSPSASYSYSCGSGGVGGAVCSDLETPNNGTTGGDTTFGSYSSANGNARANGYTNILSGQRYGYVYQNMQAQMKGADGGYIYVNNGQITFVDGESVTNPFTSVAYTGGSSIKGGISKQATELPSGSTYLSNGCGCGASYGANGTSGQTPYKAARYYIPASPRSASSASAPNSKNADVYGCGGYGGFGGAAGGSTSYYTSSSDNKNYYYYDNQANPVGENGGKGGNGYAGCIIVYY